MFDYQAFGLRNSYTAEGLASHIQLFCSCMKLLPTTLSSPLTFSPTQQIHSPHSAFSLMRYKPLS